MPRLSCFKCGSTCLTRMPRGARRDTRYCANALRHRRERPSDRSAASSRSQSAVLNRDMPAHAAGRGWAGLAVTALQLVRIAPSSHCARRREELLRCGAIERANTKEDPNAERSGANRAAGGSWGRSKSRVGHRRSCRASPRRGARQQPSSRTLGTRGSPGLAATRRASA